MLIVALALAVIGLAALVAAVVTSNEILAWVCIGASALGVLLLVVDAVRERQAKRAAVLAGAETAVIAETVVDETAADESEDAVTEDAIDAGVITEAELAADISAEEHPEEVVHDEPEFDTLGDDEPEYPQSAEASALHIVTEEELSTESASGAEDLDVLEGGDGETAEPGER